MNEFYREEWKTIPDQPTHQVSNYGRVRSLKRTIEQRNVHDPLWPITRRLPQRVVNQFTTKNGYRRVNLSGKGNTHYVHRLVLRTFVGEPPRGKSFAVHGPNGRSDNSLWNLSWGGRKDLERSA
tara:strand:- start:257 stop:628 length:372 start_codon:yes stop_codon:yes gene_type:complete